MIRQELKEYKDLLEKQLKITVDDAPIDLSYNGQHAWVMGTRSMALYALEMLPQVEYEDVVLSDLKGWGNK